MSAYQDTVQGAVICFIAVVGTGLNSALDALIGIGVHLHNLLY